MTEHLDHHAPATGGRRAARPGRHRATAAAVVRSAREAQASGLPALGSGRAVLAGVGLAVAAVGTGLLVPDLGERGERLPAGSTTATTRVGLAPATAVRLVAGRTLAPATSGTGTGRPADRGADRTVGDAASPAGATAGAGAEDGAEEPQRVALPGRGRPVADADTGSTGSTGVSGAGADGDDGGDGAGDGGADGGGDGGGEPGLLDPAEQATGPVTSLLPPPVRSTVDPAVPVVESTVAGPLGNIVP